MNRRGKRYRNDAETLFELLLTRRSKHRNLRKNPKKVSEKSEAKKGQKEMNRVEFCQSQMKQRIAPPSVGSVCSRIAYAARALRWSVSRTKDIWYGDYRIRINPEEIERIQTVTGVKYERDETGEARTAIAKANALLGKQDPNFNRAFDAAMRTFFSVLAGTGIEGGMK